MTDKPEKIRNDISFSVYPNPFSITFFDQSGKQVDVIKGDTLTRLNKLIWTPNNLPDGICFFSVRQKCVVRESGPVAVLTYDVHFELRIGMTME